MDKSNAFCTGQTGRFRVMGSLSTRSAVIFDVEGDGDLDIVTNEFNSQPQVLISDLSERRKVNFIKLILVGATSNRNGVGATVKVWAGSKVAVKYNDNKSGYLSQSVLPLYVGLGNADKVDRIEVVWPSKRKQIITAPVATNTTLRIEEGK